MGENSSLRIREALKKAITPSADAARKAIGKRLSREFYHRAAPVVGRELLGMILVHRSPAGLVGGRIVETEAYLFEGDAACHAHRGKTQRNASMFGAAGLSYIYLIYGMHYCFNVVTAGPEIGEAVLIRAVEPLFGIEIMRESREKQGRKMRGLYDLCRGPGRVAQAFGFTRALDGSSLINGPISIHRPKRQPAEQLAIARSPRIGIREAAHLKLRFFIKDCRFVSH